MITFFGWLRRSNQSILKEISPGCSLEGLMLKLKLQYFGYLMWRVECYLSMVDNLSTIFPSVQFSSVTQSCLTLCDPNESQHARPPCPSPTARACSNSCPLSQWCHPTFSSSIGPFSSWLQSFPASGSFPVSQFFTWGSQSIGVSASASVLPVTIQDWFPLGWTGWISLLFKELSRVFFNTTVQKHQFFSA